MSICSKTNETGIHVTVRCAGCGSLHHTKNIGYTDPDTHVVSVERTIFDTTPCQCLDPHAFPLVHVCGIDCGHGNAEEKAKLKKKYDMLVKSNLLRASASAGTKLDKEFWKDLQQYDSQLARLLLSGAANEEQIARIVEVNARYKEAK